MKRSHLLGAVLSLAAASAAHADGGRVVERDGVIGREHRLPLCYGNNFQVDTMLRPGGFQSLRCLPTGGGEYCSWLIGSSGTRPTHDYLIVTRTPSVPTSPPPMPEPPSSIAAHGAALGAMRAAAGPAPAPVRLTWPTGTVISAFAASSCAPTWTEAHDRSRGAVLHGAISEGDLVFALDGGRSHDDVPVDATATAEIGGCAGALVIQDAGVDGQWRDLDGVAVTPTSSSYRVDATLAPRRKVRLVLRSSGTCTVRNADIFVAT